MNAPTFTMQPSTSDRRTTGRSTLTHASFRPWFIADWRDVTFIHYAIDPAVLQPHVPFPLDLFEGRAYVSAVAFTQAGLRPAVGSALTRWITAPVGTHEFLNLRTYVRVDGRPAIYFLVEWIPSRLMKAVGPLLYGLPLRLASMLYGESGGAVTGVGRFAFNRQVDDSCFEARGGSLEAFLVERYTAFTHRDGVGRCFDIDHAPWRLHRASVEITHDRLIRAAMPWFVAAKPARAHTSAGVFDVRIGGPRRVAGPGSCVVKWGLLVLMTAAAVAFRNLIPAWAFMWSLAYAIFLGCKWLTVYDAATRASLARQLACLFAWPGMDARGFLGNRRRPQEPPPRELAAAVVKTNLGLALLYLAAPLAAVRHPMLGGWIAMIGLTLALHFGLFHLLSLTWRSFGVDAKPIMNAPWRSKTLGEFWGGRWNRGFRELAHAYVFRPLVPRFGATRAMLLTFLASGVVHDAVISLPARGGYGLPTLYFVIQSLGVLVEKSPFGRRGLRGAIGRLFAIAVVILPAPLLFHPPFVHRVILPFLRAIGAGV